MSSWLSCCFFCFCFFCFFVFFFSFLNFALSNLCMLQSNLKTREHRRNTGDTALRNSARCPSSLTLGVLEENCQAPATSRADSIPPHAAQNRRHTSVASAAISPTNYTAWSRISPSGDGWMSPAAAAGTTAGTFLVSAPEAHSLT